MNRLRVKNWFRYFSLQYKEGVNHPVVSRLQRKFPGLYRGVMLRFDPHHFSGLPLTLLALGVVLNMIILSELAEEVREASSLRNLDRFLALFFFNHRDENFAQLLYRFTRLGSSPTVLLMLSVLSFLLLKRNRFHALIAVGASLLTSSMTAYLGKVYYKVPRPRELAWYEEFSFSFPSGHATVAMAYYGVLFYLLVMYVSHPVLKKMLTLFALFFILTMGFSRVYLGVHYLSDVISGFCIGFVWLLFAVALLGWMDFRRDHLR